MTPIDHEGDLKKYVKNHDPAKVAAIIKHLGIAMKSRDAQLVSCSSKDELARVRDGWCKKKLGLTLSDDEIDKSIQTVCDKMKGDNTKSRVAFYYMLADMHGKLASL
jgi:hypothetical protein